MRERRESAGKMFLVGAWVEPRRRVPTYRAKEEKNQERRRQRVAMENAHGGPGEGPPKKEGRSGQ